MLILVASFFFVFYLWYIANHTPPLRGLFAGAGKLAVNPMKTGFIIFRLANVAGLIVLQCLVYTPDKPFNIDVEGPNQ